MDGEDLYEPKDVPVGMLELADKNAYMPVVFCDSCRKEGTPECYLCCEKQLKACDEYAYVSGAFPWECIYCNRGKNGKPIETYERDVTFDDCPRIQCDIKDAEQKAKAKKWGCVCLDLDGGGGVFCQNAVRRVRLVPDHGIPESACGHYECNIIADHAYSLWDKGKVPGSLMGFKGIREYAKERGCGTLYDLLLAFDAVAFRDCCKKHHARKVNLAIKVIEMYAQVYGWFWLGGEEGCRRVFRKALPAEQNIRVLKTVAALANREALAKEAKAKEGGDDGSK